MLDVEDVVLDVDEDMLDVENGALDAREDVPRVEDDNTHVETGETELDMAVLLASKIDLGAMQTSSRFVMITTEVTVKPGSVVVVHVVKVDSGTIVVTEGGNEVNTVGQEFAIGCVW